MHAALESSPPRPVLYMDESFIHHHYTRAKDSIYDPTDTTADEPKAKHKGRRLCFIAGVLAATPDDAHVLGLHIFEGGKQTQDYHGMFNHEYFVSWFRGVLDQLDGLGLRDVIIVMDNASYHKGLPPDTPKGNWRKAELAQACARYGILIAVGAYKKELWVELKAHIAAHVDPVVVSMAAACGHTVVYTPP